MKDINISLDGELEELRVIKPVWFYLHNSLPRTYCNYTELSESYRVILFCRHRVCLFIGVATALTPEKLR